MSGGKNVIGDTLIRMWGNLFSSASFPSFPIFFCFFFFFHFLPHFFVLQSVTPFP